MANRRMFSKAITSSAKFLKMPPSTQTLYFHLGLNADDDGVVEGFNIMRMIGSSEDELKILVAKGYVVVLNEDLVTFITDWKEHNLIRPDRKVDSIYKDLLLKVVSDANLIESRTRADLKPKEIVLLEDKSCPVDVQLTTNVQHRVGKVSSGKVKKEYSQDELDKSFTRIRKSYPGPKILKETKAKLPKLIKKYGEEELIRAIKRYSDFVEHERKNGFKDRKWMQESTWWNGKYMDYMDSEYGKDVESKPTNEMSAQERERILKQLS